MTHIQNHHLAYKKWGPGWMHNVTWFSNSHCMLIKKELTISHLQWNHPKKVESRSFAFEPIKPYTTPQFKNSPLKGYHPRKVVWKYIVYTSVFKSELFFTSGKISCRSTAISRPTSHQHCGKENHFKGNSADISPGTMQRCRVPTSTEHHWAMFKTLEADIPLYLLVNM